MTNEQVLFGVINGRHNPKPFFADVEHIEPSILSRMFNVIFIFDRLAYFRHFNRHRNHLVIIFVRPKRVQWDKLCRLAFRDFIDAPPFYQGFNYSPRKFSD